MVGEVIKENIVEVARLIYTRKLSDSAGGNISVRQGDYVFITPRYMGERRRWKIEVEDICVLDFNGRIVEGIGSPSRELSAHLGLYRSFPKVGAVIHAHPQYALVFAVAGKPLPPVTEYAEAYGTIQLVEWAKGGSEELAKNIVSFVKKREAELENHAVPVLIPRHGVIIAGRDLNDAYDTLERIDVNARCIILGRLITR